ncbi:head-tail connector protein [Sphingosinithalassobacter portus]|uniref:head-tail connector protein n=1 Tax=Stakelama portus TaxID=2676234 RepID=UPI000D6E6CCD|nr:hypothetical protein [Sphingosinithalassobacter portus]
MRVIVVTPPEPVVSWADADAHLKLDGDVTQQAIVEGYIASATEHVDGPVAPDGGLGRALGVQTLEARFDRAEIGSHILLPFPPAIELVSVTYLDADGEEQVADLADFELLGRDLIPVGSSWPWSDGSTRREAVRIRYDAGYTTLPAPIRAAILLMVGDLYANRETVTVGASVQARGIPMSTSVSNLLNPFRVYS